MVERNAILVLGMHRSGTSAATRVLNLLGAELGDSLLPIASDNPLGFWECGKAVDIHDALLGALGRTWYDLRALPSGWLESDAADVARRGLLELVRAEFADAPLWAIKDPRLCRLIPLWKEILGELGVKPHALYVVRHPEEVARSLHARDAFPVERTYLSWLQYVADAERETRDLPRAVLAYKDLLEDWETSMTRVERELRLTWPAPSDATRGLIGNFLRPEERHQRVDVAKADRKLPKLVSSTYEALLAKARGKSDWTAVRLAVNTFRIAAEAFSGGMDSIYAQFEAAHEQQVALRNQLDGIQGREALAIAAIDQARGFEANLREQLNEASAREAVATTALNQSQQAEAQVREDAAAWRVKETAAVVALDQARAVESDLQKQLNEACARKAAATTALTQSQQAEAQLREEVAAWQIKEAVAVGALDQSRVREQLMAVRVERMTSGEAKFSVNLVQARERELNLQGQLDESRAREVAAAAALEQARKVELQMREASEKLRAQGGAAEEALKRGRRQMALLQKRMKEGFMSRVRRRLSRTEFELSPIQHLEVIDPASRRWRVTGDDPMFACGSDNFPLLQGWYQVDLGMLQHSGSPVHVRMYPDYGVNMPPDMLGLGMPFVKPRQSIHRGIVRFAHPLFALRFDPAVEPCDLSVRRLVVRRVSKLRAGLTLLGAMWSANPSASATVWARLCMIVAKLRGTGLRGFGDWLYTSYMTPTGLDGYATWVSMYDSCSAQDIQDMRAKSSSMTVQPLVSILVPCYESDRKWLQRCIESVRAQTYPNWELCLVDDASPSKTTMSVLSHYAKIDNRIKVKRRSVNGHISAASNDALAMATGDWVALLDHDDELPPYALYLVAQTINDHPNTRLIYSDEDKIDENGRRFDPYFKPDWNLELFRAHNMFSHLGVYQTELIRSVVGFRKGFEGSQDYDLALRCIERVQPGQIRHIPRVLYHWRAIRGSTALGPQEKDYAHVAARKSLTAHLERVGIAAEVLPVPERTGNWRIRRKLQGPAPLVSIIIPTRNGCDILRRCIDSIDERTTYAEREVIVVDNQSDDQKTLAYMDQLRGRANCRVVPFDEPFNFARMNNLAARHADGEVLVFLNNDTQVISAEWLTEMVSIAVAPDVGAVGAMLYYPNNTIQHAGVVLGLGADRIAGHAYHLKPRGTPGDKCRAQLVQEVSGVTAACMAIRRDRFTAVNGFDEGLKVAFNDVDLCLRLRHAGYHNIWTPYAELYHYESFTRGSDLDPARREAYLDECKVMRERWGERLLADPFYHPSLSLDNGDFATYSKPRDRF